MGRHYGLKRTLHDGEVKCLIASIEVAKPLNCAVKSFHGNRQNKMSIIWRGIAALFFAKASSSKVR
jgi:hypothetical protein